MQSVFCRLDMLEISRHELHKVLMVEVTGSADDEIAGSEVVSIEAGHDRALEFFHRAARAQDRQTERVVFPETLGEDFVDQVVGIILIHFYFFENDAPLLRDIAGIEHRMKDKIGENVHGERKVLIKNFNVKADAFLRRESIHIAADGIDLAGNRFGGACLRSLEHHVLDEVRNAVPFRIFVARTGLEPDADRDRAYVGHLLGYDREAIRQDLTTNAARFFYH